MSGQTWEWRGRASGWESGEANNDEEWWNKENKESSTSWNESGQYTEYTEQEWATWKKSYSKGKKQWEGARPAWWATSTWAVGGDDSSSASTTSSPLPTPPAAVAAQAKAKQKETRDQIMRAGREVRAGGRSQPNVEEPAEGGTSGAKNEAEPTPAAAAPEPPPSVGEVLPVVEHRLDRRQQAHGSVRFSKVQT